MASNVEGARKAIYCGLCFGLPEEISPDHLLADFEQAVRDEETQKIWGLIEKVLEHEEGGVLTCGLPVGGGKWRVWAKYKGYQTPRAAIEAAAEELGLEVTDGQT